MYIGVLVNSLFLLTALSSLAFTLYSFNFYYSTLKKTTLANSFDRCKFTSDVSTKSEFMAALDFQIIRAVLINAHPARCVTSVEDMRRLGSEL